MNDVEFQETHPKVQCKKKKSTEDHKGKDETLKRDDKSCNRD